MKHESVVSLHSGPQPALVPSLPAQAGMPLRRALPPGGRLMPPSSEGAP